MSMLVSPLRSGLRLGVIAMVMAVPRMAWSQAMQQQPMPQQKSVIIQVAPAPATQAPPPPAALAPAPLAQQPPPPPAPPPADKENPGLFNEIGKLFKDTPSLGSSWTLPSLGTSGLNTVVKGRVVCPVAANGAPDCKAASDKLCQSKGYKEGKSLDTDAAQTCSPKAMIPGRKPEEGDCRTDNYVTQAVCQ
jgi:hypothetical protein